MKVSAISSLMIVVLLAATSVCSADDEKVFSGPQIGEKLVPFKVRGIYGNGAGKEVDLVTQSKGKPTVLVFVHKLTRPGFGVIQLLMTLGGQRNKDLVSGVVFLTDDQTAMEAQLKRMKQLLDGQGVPVGISTEGIEGPGAYGLNRKVTLTVLIGNKNKVTANYALIQPSVEADMPKILKDIRKQIGGKVATVKSLGGERYMRNRKTRKPQDARLIGMLRAVINKQATDDEVEKAAKQLEDYVADKPAARQDIFRRTDVVTNGPKFKDYGTELARKYLLKWAKEYAPKKPNKTQTERKPKTDRKPKSDREKKTDNKEKTKSSPKKSD